MDPSPAEGNFCDGSNCPVEPHIMEQYNWHVGYFNSSDRMASSYTMCWRTFKWTMKLFFHLLDLTVEFLISSPGAKYTHWDFRLLLMRNLIEEAGKPRSPHPEIGWKPSAVTTDVRFKSCHNQHWPAKSSTKLHCHLCSSHGQRKGIVYQCARCDVGLCVVPCFMEYHTRVNLYITPIVNSMCHDKTVIQGATDLLQQP